MNSVAASDDAGLVSASLEGDQEAFGRIVGRYQSLVCSVAYSATGSLAQSEDLAQETFLEAWKHLGGLREPEKLRSWLCGIARNRIQYLRRAQQREPSHQAESLESLADAPGAEPPPAERAISQEEADILWRALERIPETYRLPLVLFYREQQSVQNVARDLGLTEETARQRLSRGRRLLQEEVQAFVETALSRTTPGKAFTEGVVAALPLTAAMKAASGLAVAKGATGAKGLVSLPLVGGLASMVGAIVLSWKNAADEGKTARERKFLRRVGAVQVVAFLGCLAGAGLMVVSSGRGVVWLPVVLFALLALAAAINGAFVVPWVVRRQLELRAEDDVWMPPAPEGTEHSPAWRKAWKQSLPLLVMLAGCVPFLPWRKNWLGCVGYLVLPGLCVVWNMRRVYRRLRYPGRPRSLRMRTGMKHPLLIMAGMAFFICLAAIFLSNLGVRYLAWLNTGKLPELPFFSSGTKQLLLGLGIAVLVFALFAAATPRLFPALGGLKGKLRLPFLEQMQAAAGGPEAVLEKTYRPLFEELNVSAECVRSLKDLLLKRAMVGVNVGMPLMNPCLGREKRAAILRHVKTEMDGINARIQELLGDGFAVYKEFERSIPDRTLLDQFSRQTANARLALSQEQEKHLLEAMLEARRQFPWTSDLARQNLEMGFAELYTQAGVETFAREQKEFDRQFLVKAQEWLSAEQLALFEKLQTKRRESQVGQFRMGIKMFGDSA